MAPNPDSATSATTNNKASAKARGHDSVKHSLDRTLVTILDTSDRDTSLAKSLVANGLAHAYQTPEFLTAVATHGVQGALHQPGVAKSLAENGLQQQRQAVKDALYNGIKQTLDTQLETMFALGHSEASVKGRDACDELSSQMDKVKQERDTWKALAGNLGDRDSWMALAENRKKSRDAHVKKIGILNASIGNLENLVSKVLLALERESDNFASEFVAVKKNRMDMLEQLVEGEEDEKKDDN